MKPIGNKIMLLFILLLITITFLRANSNIIDTEDDDIEPFVIEMSAAEYNEYSPKNRTHLLLFYEPYNLDSKRMIKLFERVSEQVVNLSWDIDFIMINSKKNKKFTKEWKVTTYPVVFWLNSNEKEKLIYDGPSNLDGFLKYIHSTLNTTVEELHDLQSLEDKTENGSYLIFIGDNQIHDENYKNVVRMARNQEINFIYWTKSADFFSRYKIEHNSFDAIVYYLNDNTDKNIERLHLTENDSKHEVEKLIKIYSRQVLGSINNFTFESAVKEDNPTPTMFVIYNNEESYVPELSHTLEKLAKKYRKELWILNTTFESPHGRILTEVMNIEKNEHATVVIVKNNSSNIDDVDKYIMDPELLKTEDNIENFYSNFKKESLNKYIYSEEIPEEQDDEDGIITVVGKTFNELVLNNFRKDILLFLCDYTNSKCMMAREKFSILTRKLKNNQNVLFAEIDTSLNELYYIEYDKLPAIALLESTNDNDINKRQINIYTGNFLTQNILYWVMSLVKDSIKYTETLEYETGSIKGFDKEEVNKPTIMKIGFKIGLRRAVKSGLTVEYLDNEYKKEKEKEESEKKILENIASQMGDL